MRVHSRLRLNVVVLLWGGTLSMLFGCQGELPSGPQCEAMARRVLGFTERELAESPRAERFVDRLVHGCITTPFDHEAVRCMEERRNLPACMDDLVLRQPDREKSVRALLELDRQALGN